MLATRLFLRVLYAFLYHIAAEVCQLNCWVLS